MSANLTSNESYPSPQLKNFHIEKRLGTGTYATVYKAVCKNNNEVRAIKCIKKNGLNKTSTENLLREIKILKQIKHDYIVQLKDFQWDDNYIYLIMEYCSGGDLSAFIKSRRTIPEKYVRRFVQQIACALKHLHSKGIAHMDLKPQNILLTSTNNPSLKLADFGFAQYMREDKQSRSLRGSPLYMAPEILKCKVYDSKVDLWSVGVILYEVIFGYAPFISNTLDELEKKILDDLPIQIPTHIMLSETCKDLLRRLLERSPTTRITFEQFFNHPFVDLDHMASSSSYPKAIELLNKAVKADERHQYLVAQRYYLQSIEYLIPAIQFEKDANKKQEMREKAKIYLKRAEDITNQTKLVSNSKQSKSSPNSIIQNSYTLKRTSLLERSFSNLGISNNQSVAFNSSACSSSINNYIQPSTSSNEQQRDAVYKYHSLLKHFDGNKQVLEPIIMCINAEDKVATLNNCEEIYNQYELAISKLLPLIKNYDMPKEIEKLLKQSMNNWLTKAEHIKMQLNERSNELGKLISTPDNINADDEENSGMLNQCLVQ